MTDLQTPYQDKINAARQAGFSDSEINAVFVEKRQAAMDAGFTPSEINDALGQGTPSLAVPAAHANAGIDANHVANEQGDKPPLTLQQSIDYAWGMSMSSLIGKRQLPQGPAPTGHEAWWNTIAATVVQAAGDLPVSVPAFMAGAGPGAAGGAAAGAMVDGVGAIPGAAIGAGITGGGASGYITETTRAAYIDFLQSHPNASTADAKTFIAGVTASALKRYVQMKGLKGGLIGAATGVAGPVAGKFLEPVANPVVKGLSITAAEMGAAVTASAAVEGQLPRRDDFAGIAAMILAAKLGHAATKPIISAVSDRLQAHYVRTGETPDVVQAKMKTDPKFSQEILSGEDATQPGAHEQVIPPDETSPTQDPQTVRINPKDVYDDSNVPLINEAETMHTKMKLAAQKSPEPKPLDMSDEDFAKFAGTTKEETGTTLEVEYSLQDGSVGQDNPSSASVGHSLLIKQNGETVARATTSYDPESGTVYVGNIGPLSPGGLIRHDVSADLGPKVVRQLLKQLRNIYPDMKKIEGHRVTGARTGHPRQFTSMNLDNINVDMDKVTRVARIISAEGFSDTAKGAYAKLTPGERVALDPELERHIVARREAGMAVPKLPATLAGAGGNPDVYDDSNVPLIDEESTFHTKMKLAAQKSPEPKPLDLSEEDFAKISGVKKPEEQTSPAEAPNEHPPELTPAVTRTARIISAEGFSDTAKEAYAKLSPGERAALDPELERHIAARREAGMAVPKLPATLAGAGGKPPVEPPVGRGGATGALPPPEPRPMKMMPPTLDEATSSILGHTTAKPSKSYDLDDARYDAFNELQYIVSSAERAHKGATGQTLDVTKNPGELARLAYGAHGQAEADIKRGIYDPATGKKIGKSLKEVINSVPKADRRQFLAYWLSKRVLDKESQGVETGFDLDSARVAAEHGDFNPKFRQALFDIGEWNDNGLMFKVKSGMLSKVRAEAAIAKDEFYIPFQRLFESESGRGGAGRGIPVRQTMKSISGSNRLVVDPLRMLIQNRALDRQINANNLARQRIVEFNEHLPEEWSILEETTKFVKKPDIEYTPFTEERPPSKALTVPSRGIEAVTDEDISRALQEPQLKAYMEDHGLKPEDVTPHMMWNALSKTAEPGKFAVFYDGKPRWFRAKDPDLIKSLEAMDRQSFNLILKVIATPAAMLRVGATSTVEFMNRAMWHDMLTSPIINDFKVTPLTVIKGLASSVKADAWFERWVANGGAYSSMLDMDRQLLQGGAYDIHAQQTPASTLWNAASTPLKLARATSALLGHASVAVSDRPMRIGTFRNGIQQGLSPEEAALNSRDVNLDFARIGRSVRAVNLLSAFFAARINGVARTIGAFQKRPLQSSALAVGLITMPTVLLWLNNKDEKWYQNMPVWQKAAAWHIRIGGTPDNPGWVLPIPKPPLIGTFFGTAPEMMLDAANRDNPHLAEQLASTIASDFNLLPNLTAATPFIEIGANFQFFDNRPLVSDRLKGLLPQYRYSQYTSETAKKLSQGLVASGGVLPENFRTPIAIEYMWKSYAGDIGSQLLKAVDGGLRLVGAYPATKAPAPDMADIPVVRAFFARTDGASQALNDFYTNADLADQAVGSYKEMIRQGSYTEAQGVMKKYGKAMLNTAQARQSIANMQNIVRGIWYDKRMAPDQKRQLIDGYMAQMNAMAGTFNRFFDYRQEHSK